MGLVYTTIDNRIGTITLDSPTNLNALSEPLIDDVIEALSGFVDAKASAVILRANDGVRVWSAGHDVSELPLSGCDPLGWHDPLRVLVREIQSAPMPVIAMIEGGVWGGACEVVFSCDMVVATTNSTFAVTPAKLGVPYNTTGVLNFMYAASRLIMREMVFTAQPIAAERAEMLGMINYAVEKEALESTVKKLTDHILQNAPLSIAVIKEQMRLLESAHSMTPRMFECVQGLRRTVYNSNDYNEGITAFIEKRKPVFSGE